MQLLEKRSEVKLSPAEISQVDGEGNPGCRRFYNSVFMLYYVVLAFFGMAQYWSYDMPGCSSHGVFHRFIGMWLYKPFFLPYGMWCM
jgi:hypothetical protein